MPRLIVPAYGYPTQARAMWDGLLAAPDAISDVILNPGDGPGTLRDPVWVHENERLGAAGIRALGYLNLGHGGVPVTQVLEEARRWRRWYGVGDFFLDCAPSRDVDYTSEVVRALRGRGGAGRLVGNPGTQTLPAVAELFDLVVDREGPPGGGAPVPSAPSRPVHQGTPRSWVVHSASREQAGPTLAAAAAAGVAVLWITDLSGANPYRGLPSYWDWLAGAARA